MKKQVITALAVLSCITGWAGDTASIFRGKWELQNYFVQSITDVTMAYEWLGHQQPGDLLVSTTEGIPAIQAMEFIDDDVIFLTTNNDVIKALYNGWWRWDNTGAVTLRLQGNAVFHGSDIRFLFVRVDEKTWRYSYVVHVLVIDSGLKPTPTVWNWVGEMRRLY